jgi:hypothetical protein
MQRRQNFTYMHADNPIANQFFGDLLEPAEAPIIDRLVPDQLQKYFPD